MNLVKEGLWVLATGFWVGFSGGFWIVVYIVKTMLDPMHGFSGSIDSEDVVRAFASFPFVG